MNKAGIEADMNYFVIRHRSAMCNRKCGILAHHVTFSPLFKGLVYITG